jgi:hypothetical protein
MISRYARALAAAVCALSGAVATAAAEPEPEAASPPAEPHDLVIATDPDGALVVAPGRVAYPVTDPAFEISPPIEPEPYGLPPAPYEHPTPRESVIILATASQAHLTGPGGFEVFGHGGSLSFGFLQRTGEFPTGFDVAAVFVRGPDAAVYDLSMRVLGSPRIGKRKLLPFIAIGLAAGASRLVTAEDKAAGRTVEYGLSIGPSAALGLHGFLGEKVYWRGGAGFLGTGIGTYTADLGVGVVID